MCVVLGRLRASGFFQFTCLSPPLPSLLTVFFLHCVSFPFVLISTPAAAVFYLPSCVPQQGERADVGVKLSQLRTVHTAQLFPPSLRVLSLRQSVPVTACQEVTQEFLLCRLKGHHLCSHPAHPVHCSTLVRYLRRFIFYPFFKCRFDLLSLSRVVRQECDRSSCLFRTFF